MDPERAAEATHEDRPEQAHLEAQHGPGHGTDGECHRHDERPAPREEKRDRVAPAQADRVGDENQARQPDAQTGKDDVEAEREGHLRSRGDELAGVDGQESER